MLYPVLTIPRVVVMAEEDSDEEEHELLEQEWLPFVPDLFTREIVPERVSLSARQLLRRERRKFLMEDGVLFRKIRHQGKSLEVKVPIPEYLEQIHWDYHQSLGHLAAASLFPLLKSRF